ncbi:hypothetical protein ADK67_47650 [Saccharothrix sp. NRRL B-16348]|uniref:hypothetical protein n=1 Tax=Saccharothrix sp. NRRL B-16348 TaxID=1415542 RepID=UPI0006B03EA7|nr:hypothetical protein [Saccharothrix sp. NRRL B-16348]KOX12074.1 hypothetical protein ADK67_47650 [Saccharothrix sp. NRRL B-16348]
MISIRRAAAAVALALTLGAVVGVPAASAKAESAWADDFFSLCVPDDAGCYGYTHGWIVWGNRTASISGTVANEYASGFVTAYFEAYAGSTKIDSDTRSVSSGTRGFPITLGNPDLVGGFDRTKVTVCWHGTEYQVCSRPQHHWRD